MSIVTQHSLDLLSRKNGKQCISHWSLYARAAVQLQPMHVEAYMGHLANTAGFKTDKLVVNDVQLLPNSLLLGGLIAS